MMQEKSRPATWPYLFALMLAALVTLPTWSLLSWVGVDEPLRRLMTGAFLTVTACGLLVYMHCCVRRHLGSLRRAAAPARGCAAEGRP
jgi:hypothetical protein